MPSITQWSALAGLGKAGGESLKDLLANRYAEKELQVKQQEAQERQQTLENWRKAQEDQIRFNMEQAEQKRKQFLDYINNPNTTPEMKRAAEYVYYTGQSPSGDLVSGMSAENKHGLDVMMEDLKQRHALERIDAEGKRGGRTAAERAIPPEFASEIAAIAAKYGRNTDEALQNYDYKVKTGAFFDQFGYDIDPSQGRTRLSNMLRAGNLAGATPDNVPDWVKNLLNKGKEGISKATGIDIGGGGGGTAAPGGTSAPGSTVVPGLRAIPEVPFQDMGEVPIGPMPSPGPPRSSRGVAPNDLRGTPSAGPGGEEIWSLLNQAGAPGEPELPSAETIFNLLNSRANRAPTKQGITTGRERVKPKKKPVRLKERLQIEGYDVIPMR